MDNGTDATGEKLHRTMDAQQWAEEFMRRKFLHNFAVDEELMRAWFANAIMCGFDHGRRAAERAESDYTPFALRRSIDRVGERLERLEERFTPAPEPVTVAETPDWPMQSRREAGRVPPPGQTVFKECPKPFTYAGEMYPDAENGQPLVPVNEEARKQNARKMAQVDKETKGRPTEVAITVEGFEKCPLCGSRGVVRTMDSETFKGAQRRQIRCERGHWYYERN